MLGGEMGLMTGSASATRTITRDPDSRRRIEEAFRLFQVDVLKRQLNALEREGKERNADSSRRESEADSTYSWERLKDQAGGMVSSLRPSGDNV